MAGCVDRIETSGTEAGIPSMEPPVRVTCEGVGAKGSSPAHWKSGKLMTADTLSRGSTARVYEGCSCKREGSRMRESECVSLFLSLWRAPDCSCHLHLGHKGLMGGWTWQEGGTPICLMSDFAEWLCKHLSITVEAGRALQYRWNLRVCMFNRVATINRIINGKLISNLLIID